MKLIWRGPQPPLRFVGSDLIGEDAIRLTYVPAWSRNAPAGSRRRVSPLRVKSRCVLRERQQAHV